MPDSNQPQHWHMKKEINIAHILSTLMMLVAGMMYLTSLSERISKNSYDIKNVQQLRKEDQRRVEKQLDSIQKKLDRLLEQR